MIIRAFIVRYQYYTINYIYMNVKKRDTSDMYCSLSFDVFVSLSG